MHYGMKEKNPLNSVKFYPKNRPDGMPSCMWDVLNIVSNQYLECYYVQRGDLSLLMPNQFAEILLRVYTKDVRFFGIVQAGYRSLLENYMQSSRPTSIDVQVSDSDGVPERPRTPTTLSRVSSLTKSFSVEPGDSGESGSPYHNQFTTVRKAYGKSLVHPTSPTKLLAPRPTIARTLNSDLGQLETMDALPVQAPTSPTRAKPEPKIPAAPSGGGDNSPRGIAAGNASPAKGPRSSKRLREDRGGSSNAREQSGSGSTPGKRKRV